MSKHSEEYKLLDALDLYGDIMNEILTEVGVDSNKFTREDLHDLARTGFSKFNDIWQEFVLWVLYGDDKRAKTMALLKAARRKNGSLF